MPVLATSWETQPTCIFWEASICSQIAASLQDNARMNTHRSWIHDNPGPYDIHPWRPGKLLQEDDAIHSHNAAIISLVLPCAFSFSSGPSRSPMLSWYSCSGIKHQANKHSITLPVENKRLWDPRTKMVCKPFTPSPIRNYLTARGAKASKKKGITCLEYILDIILCQLVLSKKQLYSCPHLWIPENRVEGGKNMNISRLCTTGQYQGEDKLEVYLPREPDMPKNKRN
jgi:hypothetical protein